ncbi:Regulator of protease activity HflC [Commensalibacter communis]|uniref:slipin family protein n=1 Tax=Commensalibacter communis TaxID=2972786 RepID=UPI0022FF62D4|nr:slipin family protein [Commensalibacter communis]CAI3926881.1 Regulator of protease activity HflC [Commensalibacter communis]CAI3932456.1 Regulator of protease activity HflC [Commensalibacter communis]
MTQSLIERITGKKTIIVQENERMIASYQGRVLGFYSSGVHSLPNRDHSLEYTIYNLNQPVFSSDLEKIIRRKIPRELERHVFIIVANNNEICIIKNGISVYEVLMPNTERLLWKDAGEWSIQKIVISNDYRMDTKIVKQFGLEQHVLSITTNENEVCIIRNGNLVYDVLSPNKECLLWKDGEDWSLEKITIPDDCRVDNKVAKQLVVSKKASLLVTSTIESYEKGILRIDGIIYPPLEAGTYYFWNIAVNLTVKKIDLRRQTLDITGQELLTRDRVTIRINLTADYTVEDPMMAVSAVKDYQAALYNTLQLTFRKTLGEMSLDQILDRKFAIGDETMAMVRAEMKSIGLEVHNIDLKDVILPGEMRDIFNQVVAAEKQAETNVIRRREETNATRSLLNTAKVMADNPIMLRLKELESLEAIAAKVDHLTVHNGTEGLMNDLVKLRSGK